MFSAFSVNSQCYDTDRNCYYWSRAGYCRSYQYQGYMLAKCKRSCNQCKSAPRVGSIVVKAQDCKDMNVYCSAWAKRGECSRNPRYMLPNCKKSCGKCKVDGKYSSWLAYSACSKSCGGGVKIRKRLCNNPRPANGGRHCSGPSSQSMACNIHKCPVDGKFGPWQAFSGCSSYCGGGFKFRKRLCNNPKPANGGKQCSGPSSESVACNTHKCPVDGKFGPWLSYSGCSKSCGGGFKVRKRLCDKPIPANGGKPCSGPFSQSVACNTQRCPVTVVRPAVTSINDMYCGLRPADRSEPAVFRVAGGTDAEKGEWPWLVGIFRKFKLFPDCGGSLINEQWVLTAAHCFRKPYPKQRSFGRLRKSSELVVRLNEHDLRAKDDGKEIETDVEKFILHPGFNTQGDNDIALLKLARPVKYNTTSAIRSICLPTPNIETVPDEVCHVAGWGIIPDKSRQALILQKAKLKILPKSKCKSYDGMNITSNMFCAGSVHERLSTQDVCKGDSGGPFACVHDNSKFELTGIVSWGPQPCGQEGEHGFFAKVNNYIDWIKNTVQS
eukprot:Seg1413.5 transcript_id=Seg1413.5/GoldUCD/mRNA.D3Y31 product=Hemicentin-1 protein_id=Seg1413.5/GoldUCD/D3Y31